MDETLVHDPKERMVPAPMRTRATDDQGGSLLGDYRLLRKIAAGGMGEVYEAIQVKLDRRVALKLVANHLAGNPHFLQRFEREAKAAAALNHPNIVQIYDFGCVQGQYYLAMEYVDGQDLGEVLAAEGRIDTARALDIIEQTAAALKSALLQQIIHRDIKPSNLLLTKGGQVKVSDLGLAKRLDEVSEVTMTGASLGSPHFLAPEQADDARTVDHRADIYALGITLLYLVTGKRPFDHSSALSIVLAHAQKPLPTGLDLGTKLPAEVETIVQKMAAKLPENRYQSYDELLRDIALVKQGSKPLAIVSRSRTRPALPWASAGVGALLAAVGLVAFFYKKQAVPSSVRPAEASANNAEPHRVRFGPGEFERGERRGGPAAPWERGGEGPQENGGSIPLPMPPPSRPERSAIADGPIPEMLATANEYARTNKEAYRSIIDRFGQVLEKARGTQWENDAGARLEVAIAAHQMASQRVIGEYKARMEKFAQEQKFAEAYNVWRDFPPGLRTWELDREIEQILSAVLPPDFRPFGRPPR